MIKGGNGTRVAARRLRDEKGKVALVLAGGGIIGGVYQIGALKALNDFLVGRTVNDFDIYVGTSCGSFVASCLANRITPEEMMASLAGERVEGFRFHRSDILRLNTVEAIGKLLRLPWECLSLLYRSARNLSPLPLSDIYYRAMRLLPSGIYDSDSIDEVLSQIFRPPRCNDFKKLARELCVAVTDLQSSHLRVFSAEDCQGVTISRAVAASTAIPIVYRPVRIGGRDYVDGGLTDTMHVDVAIRRGAKLLICINPLVPYVNDGRGEGAGHHVFNLGFPFVGKQVVRTILASRVAYDLRLLRRRRPDVDVILIQPSEHDFRMFYNPIMKYATRVEVAVHGFTSACRALSQDFHHHRDVLRRHGMDAQIDSIAQELAAMEALGPSSRATAAILEGVSRKYRMVPTRRGPLQPLQHALHDLEVALADRGRAPAGPRRSRPRRRASQG